MESDLHLPAGFAISWSGQSEAIARANQRLKLVVPITLAIVILLIYVNTQSAMKTLIVLLAVPFSAIGAVWSLYFLHYNLSIATWVGFIALLSIDAETGIFMLLYLDLAYEDALAHTRMISVDDLRRCILYGAAKRLRPKFMTFAATCIGLLPVMWSVGTGSEVMKRIAAPMVGGIFTSFALELLVYPAIYELWRGRSIQKTNVDPGALEDEKEKHKSEPALVMMT
jgi:Cu(I)/Ag(I) efflux system membrane protein CusA/SilA